MKITPRGEWLVIEPIDANKVNGLWVPDSGKAAYKQGKVLGVPNEPDDKAKGIKVGDLIVYDTVGVVDFNLGNKKVFMLKAREIMGHVELEEADK